MRRILMVCGLGFVLVLAACANQHRYAKGDADVHKHDADLADCRAKVMTVTSSRDETVDALDQCMADKGYTKEISKFGY